MPALSLVLPGPLDTATGGYRYDRHMVVQLRQLGCEVTVHTLPAEFPFPSATALRAAAELFDSFPAEHLVLVDGLALGALPDVAAAHAKRLRLAALVHHPLHAETGLSADQQRSLFAAERRALEAARIVFVTSAATADLMFESALVRQRPVVVVPGTESAPLRQPSNAIATRMLCVATLTPRKCHALLFTALAQMQDCEWTLDCVGSATFHPPTSAALREQLTELGLGTRVRLLGERTATELQQLHLASDLFVLPAAFEGYGMAVAEALAQGLPVVATRTGAAAELVTGGAGLLVEPGDLEGLTDALRTLLADPVRREACATAARQRALTLPRWQDSARLLATELASVAAQ
jgi:glycosyltransferase involved in cell wall biosynthesis